VPHHTPLIATIVVGLVTAFIFGAVANRLRVSPLAGYLLAGVAVGPFTPGFVADQGMAAELAEIGIILLMFGVGLHFSIKDLMSVRGIAIPGALAQIAVATVLGTVFAYGIGWSVEAGIVFGLALSVASTVVLIRALQERHLLESERGRIAIGWLIVEDLVMVLAVVVLPTLGGHPSLSASAVLATLAITCGKAIAFVAIMLVVGRKAVPALLHYVAHTGSRELFRLAVLTIALGFAYGAAVLFGVSFALGAFFAGMVLSESQLSQRAAEESLPLRDAFAVLFFVSVGMLFDPGILMRAPLQVIAVFLIIVVGKSLAAYLIVRAFRHKAAMALSVAASLAQIGEFSFILANLGVTLDVLPETGRDLILAGALLSILANPLVFFVLEGLRTRIERTGKPDAAPAPASDAEPLVPTKKSGHIVLVGFGRVGRIIHAELTARGSDHLIVEVAEAPAAAARATHVETLYGNGVDEALLTAANIAGARLLFVAIPNSFEAGQVVEQARGSNPHLKIIARAHSDDEVEYLTSLGANITLMGEREIALGMVAHAFEDASSRT